MALLSGLGRRRGRVPPLDGRPGGARGGTRPRPAAAGPGGAYALTGLAIGALMVAVALVAGLPLLAAHDGPGLGADDVALVAVGA